MRVGSVATLNFYFEMLLFFLSLIKSELNFFVKREISF